METDTTECWCRAVHEGEIGVVERCGKYTKTVDPGCRFIGPSCCFRLKTKSTKVSEMRTRCQVKCKDNVFMSLEFTVMYQVIPKLAHQAFYALSDPQGQITHYIADKVRAHIPFMTMDEVFDEREELSRKIKDELQDAMDDFGFMVLNLLITDLDPVDQKLKSMMNLVYANQKLRMAKMEEAEMEKYSMIMGAEAEADADELQGVGIAKQRAAIIAGLGEAVHDFKSVVKTEVAPREVMDLIVITQYIDALKKLAANKSSDVIFTQEDVNDPNLAQVNVMREAVLQGLAGAKTRAD